jgi:hypothetical protein
MYSPTIVQIKVFYCAVLRFALGRYGVDGFRRCDSMAIPGESEPF